jgi:hypothetical protein
MSTFKVDTLQSTTGGVTTLTNQSAAKAWCNADNSHAIQDSFNISSVSDGGTGNYTMTVTNAMSNSDFSYSGIAGNTTFDDGFWAGGSKTTTTYFVRCRTHNGNLNDAGEASTVLHGDLA